MATAATETDVVTTEGDESNTREGWRKTFIDYYTTNAPENVVKVTDELLNKWEGKYEKLFAALQKKYGLPGHPIVPPKVGLDPFLFK